LRSFKTQIEKILHYPSLFIQQNLLKSSAEIKNVGNCVDVQLVLVVIFHAGKRYQQLNGIFYVQTQIF